jgi:hypothetical protein
MLFRIANSKTKRGTSNVYRPTKLSLHEQAVLHKFILLFLHENIPKSIELFLRYDNDVSIFHHSSIVCYHR